MCKACTVAYKQAHYAASKQRYVDNAGARRNASARSGCSSSSITCVLIRCVARGEADVMVLEFDHLGEKLFSSPGDPRPVASGAPIRDGEVRGRVRKLSRRRTAIRGGFLRAVVAQR
jgi:hypothetical protein